MERAIQQRAARLGVDWSLWGIVLNTEIPDGLAAIRSWAWADVVEAHAVMDAVREIRDLRREREAYQNG